MSSFRIGVVGAGIIGRTHISTIARTEGTELACLVDPGQHAQALADAHGVPLRATVEDLIEAGSIDGVVVATPNETHVGISSALLKAGLPVLLEKPIANTLPEALTLLDIETRTGVPVLVGHHRRHNPLVKAAKQAIDEGAIGELVMATVICSLMKPPSYFDMAWRRTPGVGGPLLINLIHEVDLMRHFFGDVASVSAVSSNDIRGFEVEDTAAAILRFVRAGVGTLAVSDAAVGPWAWDLSAGENLERFPAHPVQSHFFAGTEGGLSLPDLSHWSHKGPKDWAFALDRQTIAAEAEDAYVMQLRHFCEVIAGRADPLVPAIEAAKNLATITAIRSAAASGRETPVEFPISGTGYSPQDPKGAGNEQRA